MLLVKDGMSPMYMDLLLDCIIDYWKTTEAIKQEDAFIESQNGTKRRKETTKGWEILICWKDASTTWNKMKDVKDSYPAQLAEYTVQQGIDKEPAFAWWVPCTIKKKG